MSFAHYDEIVEICLGMAEREERLNKVEHFYEEMDFDKNYFDELELGRDELFEENKHEEKVLLPA